MDKVTYEIAVSVTRSDRDRTWKVEVSANGVYKEDTFGSDSAAALYVAAAVQDLLTLE